ncbi:hypothetical protein GWI33_005179 [Rhynchophorus ferrugineus]|uniref:Uncharacterized protein n=1 Tax=Rhynchophorus ferrugineus TaxID=354439 RepID=A0A834IKP1_RHYFE|nr:hypothetical protein GWI33_005179 [Rhynchophorus ferrugineus]
MESSGIASSICSTLGTNKPRNVRKLVDIYEYKLKKLQKEVLFSRHFPVDQYPVKTTKIFWANSRNTATGQVQHQPAWHKYAEKNDKHTPRHPYKRGYIF